MGEKNGGKVIDGFESVMRVADFIHWVQDNHPEILEEYEKEIKELAKLTDENKKLKKKYKELDEEKKALLNEHKI